MSLFDSQKLSQEALQERVELLEKQMKQVRSPMQSLYGSTLEVTDSDTVIDENGISIGGTTIANTAGELIGQLISDTLNTQTAQILAEYTFSESGALAIKTDANNGVWLSPTGILAKKSGSTTFAVDNGGNATFKGTVAAGSVLAAGDIASGGTISGCDFKAVGSTSGSDIWIQGDGYLRFRYNNNTEGYMYVNSSGNMIIDADKLIYLRADGSGDDIFVSAGDNITLSGNTLFTDFTGDTMMLCDNHAVFYDEDNDGGQAHWYSDGDRKMRLDTGGELFIEDGATTGGEDFAEFFENLNTGVIPVGKSVVLDTGKIREATEGEIPFGVISNTASYIGNNGAVSAGMEWNGKYLLDDDGNPLTEEREMWRGKVEVTYKKPTGQVAVKNVRIKGYVDSEQIPANIVDLHYTTKTEKIVNPEYDTKKEYIPRADRPEEWSIVGLLGQVKVLKGQQINPNWVFMREYNNKYDLYLIK